MQILQMAVSQKAAVGRANVRISHTRSSICRDPHVLGSIHVTRTFLSCDAIFHFISLHHLKSDAKAEAEEIR